MSLVIDIVATSLPADDKAAWAIHSELREQYFDDTRAPAPALARFVDAISARYPCISTEAGAEIGAWSDGPLINNFCGDMGALGIASGADMDQVVAFVMARAADCHLSVFDPQSGAIYRPPVSGYSVTMQGVAPGFARESVVAALANMVKRDPDQIATLLGTPGTVVKQGLDAAMAEKYRAALTRIGCVCAITAPSKPAPVAAAAPLSPQAQYQTLLAAAQAGAAGAQFDLAQCIASATFIIEREQRAAEWLAKAAEQGHAEASFAIAQCYYEGKGVLKNDGVALHWARAGAEKDHVPSQYMLSVMLQNGEGGRREASQAEALLAKATEAGYAKAQYASGRKLYARGDMAQAAAWLHKAAKQGEANAMCLLGLMYASGQGVPRDVVQSMGFYASAAEAGLAEAQYSLAMALEGGIGIAPDDAQSLHWMRKAAEQGHANAQWRFGQRLRLGMGSATSAVDGAKWIAAAAQQGHMEAQTTLGLLYSQGDGVPQDKSQALHWLQAGAEQGDAEACRLLALLRAY